MKKGALLLFLLSCLDLTAGEQTGYRVCGMMEDEHDRLKCLEIVRGATRAYPITILHFCENLERGSHRNRVLAAAKDRVFPLNAVEVCSDFASDEKIKTLLECVEKAGSVKPRLKKATSVSSEVYVYDWSTYKKAVDAAEANAAHGCQGWSYYAFSNPDWKTQLCWASAHSRDYVAYTLQWVPQRTSRGTQYHAPVPVAYNATRAYKLYHCRANYYCGKWEKDFSEVQGD